MSRFIYRLVWLATVLAGASAVSAFTTNDADTIFNAYNNAFYVANGGNSYYKINNGTGTNPGWWTYAEEIEMAEDAHDNSPTTARKNIVASLCNGFVWSHGTLWTGNVYNDDISWGVIAFSRAYLITGNPSFREIAKNNFDAMFSRAWDTNFTGGGLWWRTDNQFKNAAVNGPAAIAACYLYQIYGDSSYLSNAKDCYAWERRVLFNANSTSGAISDGIDINTGYNHWASTYNQGTFIGVANFLYQITGLPVYYQDAILAATYTRNSIADGAGILPEYGTGDLAGFHGIFGRWMARFAKDQNLWLTYGPWLTANANAAWSVRNVSNLAWQKWKTATPTGVLDSWDCSAAMVMLQVASPSPADALQITPAAGFTAVAQQSLPPNPAGTILVLTNTGPASINWSLSSTSSWLSVSASSGTLPGGSVTNVTVSLLPSATIELPVGRHYAGVWVTNLASGATLRRLFTLVISGGDTTIALTGYNASLLARNTATVGTPNATAFDIPNNYCFYQAGLPASTHGLPPDGTFTSQWDGTTVFQLPAYGGANALVLGNAYPSSGTLTLVIPTVYDSISVLACSANGGGTGTFVLDFTNGTHSQVFGFNAQDWFTTTPNVAIHGFGRLKLGAGFYAEDNGTNNPNLYQTTINLAALGLNQPIASITFTKPAGAGAQLTCGIFAVSGHSPYQEPVITQQPTPTEAFRFAGDSNSWSVAANAGLPVYYSWLQNGVPIPTATNATYQLTNLLTNHSGSYSVLISNAFGAITSSIVSLTVAPAPTYPFGQMVRADGAVGYWRLDETSGTLAHDYAAGNHGSYTPKVLLGQPGNNLLDTHKAARFGSLATSGSCVTNIAVDFAASGNGVFTVEAWVNGGAQTTDAGLVTKGYGSGGEQFNLDCGGGNHAFRFFVRDASGGARLATSSVVPNNQWQHLVGVCDQANGYVRLYVNGVSAAQGSITPNSGILSSASAMSIGARQAGLGTAYNNQFVGLIEEVAVYNYALNSTQVLAHYQTVTNRPPQFFSNPFTVASVTAGQSTAASIDASAIDPNGDAITFAKVSGPGWLSVAGNGSLGGTPVSGNVGLNGFVVRATDPSGLSSTATMNLEVLAAPPIITSGVLQGNALLLNWTGGIALYQVQWTTNLLNPGWQNLGVPVSANSMLVSPSNTAAFYRVYGQ